MRTKDRNRVYSLANSLIAWVAILGFIEVPVRADTEIQLDVNDVSILWPPSIDRDSANQLWSIDRWVTLDVFSKILEVTQNGELDGKLIVDKIALLPEETVIKNWRVVALRIDPCAPPHGTMSTVSAQPEVCVQEIRLVAQPVIVQSLGGEFGDQVFLPDLAMHLLFEVSAGDASRSKDFRELVASLVKIKKLASELSFNTSGVPLKVHPAMHSKLFREGLKNLLPHIERVNLFKITVSGAVSPAGPWLFFQGLVSSLQNAFVLETDRVLRFESSQKIISQNGNEPATLFPIPDNGPWNVESTESSAPSAVQLFLNILPNFNLLKPALLSSGVESKSIQVRDIPFLLNNPRFTRRTNTDCVSCHVATSRSFKLGLEGADSKFAFKSPEGVTAETPLKHTADADFRAFGWFGSRAVVSQRVVNESALAADVINRLSF
jgi:hypothetical protein